MLNRRSLLASGAALLAAPSIVRAQTVVGVTSEEIKIGSITQSERLAKYNRLLEIEAATKLPIVAWPG